jgi:hypothetical protein
MRCKKLKGSGVMSPKLGSLAEVTREGTPLYELNPSPFIKRVKMIYKATPRESLYNKSESFFDEAS